MGKSCKDMARVLRDCLVTQPCMQQGGSLKDCLRSKEYHEECMELKNAYFSCRRGQSDMRTRIRGPKGGSSHDTD